VDSEKAAQFQKENAEWWAAAELDGTFIIHGVETRTAVLKNSEDALVLTQEADEGGDDQVIMLRPVYVADLLYSIGKLFPDHFRAAANALSKVHSA
jgi:hypothetical protein